MWRSRHQFAWFWSSRSLMMHSEARTRCIDDVWSNKSKETSLNGWIQFYLDWWMLEVTYKIILVNWLKKCYRSLLRSCGWWWNWEIWRRVKEKCELNKDNFWWILVKICDCEIFEGMVFIQEILILMRKFLVGMDHNLRLGASYGFSWKIGYLKMEVWLLTLNPRQGRIGMRFGKLEKVCYNV